MMADIAGMIKTIEDELLVLRAVQLCRSDSRLYEMAAEYLLTECPLKVPSEGSTAHSVIMLLSESECVEKTIQQLAADCNATKGRVTQAVTVTHKGWFSRRFNKDTMRYSYRLSDVGRSLIASRLNA